MGPVATLRVFRIIARTGICCVVGAAALTGASTTAAQSALASCATQHVNVEAIDNSGAGYFGNFAWNYVNSSNSLGNLQSTVARTILIFDSQGTDNVEFGWGDNDYGYNVPTVASDYMMNGVTFKPTFYPSFGLSFGTSYRFRIENVGDVEIFRYYIDGQTSPIGYSPTMSFNNGFAITNDEHYNSCDTLFADMSTLQDMDSTGSWYNYTSIACEVNTSTNQYIHIPAADEEEVDQTADSWGGPGCGP